MIHALHNHSSHAQLHPSLKKDVDSNLKEQHNILMQICELVSKCYVESSNTAEIQRQQLRTLEGDHTDITHESASMMRKKGGTQLLTTLGCAAIFAASLCMPDANAQQITKFLSEQVPHLGTMINQLQDSSIHESSNRAQLCLAEYNHKSSNTQSQTMVLQALNGLLSEVQEIMKRASTFA